MCRVKTRVERYLGGSLLSHVRHFKIIMQTNWQRNHSRSMPMCKRFAVFLLHLFRAHYDTPSKKCEGRTAICICVYMRVWFFFCRCFFGNRKFHHNTYTPMKLQFVCVYTTYKIRNVNIVFVTLYHCYDDEANCQKHQDVSDNNDKNRLPK